MYDSMYDEMRDEGRIETARSLIALGVLRDDVIARVTKQPSNVIEALQAETKGGKRKKTKWEIFNLKFSLPATVLDETVKCVDMALGLIEITSCTDEQVYETLGIPLEDLPALRHILETFRKQFTH